MGSTGKLCICFGFGGEKFGLKLNIQKMRIMASGPTTSWEIDGETVETVSDFIFGCAAQSETGKGKSGRPQKPRQSQDQLCLPAWPPRRARILKWVAISFCSGLSNPGIKPRSPALQADDPMRVLIEDNLILEVEGCSTP